MANVYKVTAYMFWGGIGGRSWRQTFEMAYGPGDIDTPATNIDDLTPEEFVFDETVAQDFAEFFRTLLLTPVYLDRITVSTWLPDTREALAGTHYYGATEIKVFPIGEYGRRIIPVGERALDLEQTLFVRRDVLSGRLGRLPLRGVLQSGDTQTNLQGKTILDPGSPVAPGGSVWLAAVLNLAEYMGAAAEGALRLCMYGKTIQPGSDGNLRDVQSLTPAGIQSVNLTRRNKAPTEQALVQKLLAKGYTVTSGS